MAEPRRQPQPTDDDLAQALSDLGRHLAYPERPDLARAVRARLAAGPPPKPSLWSRLMPSSPRLQFASALLVLLILFAVVLLVSPASRTAIADRLGLPGVAISTDPAATVPIDGSLQIGEPVTLAAARETAEFGLLPPPVDVIGDPDAVYLLERPAGPQVTYVYRPTQELPETSDSGIGMLISQFAGRTNESFIRKLLSPGTTIELVAVNGGRGFWIEGEPHVFFYEDPSGNIQEQTIRLAGNVLLWEHDGTTLRIESDLAKNDALRIAEAMTARAE